MKKRALLVLPALLFAAAVVVGCGSTPKRQVMKDMKTLSYTNQPNGELELINRTEYELVIFAGTIDRKNILGGIHAGDSRAFDFRAYVNSQSGAFLCRAVNKEIYEQKSGFINETDVVWAKLVTFGEAKSSFTIVPEVAAKENSYSKTLPRILLKFV